MLCKSCNKIMKKMEDTDWFECPHCFDSIKVPSEKWYKKFFSKMVSFVEFIGL